MNAKELADTVVALGVGRQGTAISADGVGFYYTPTDENTHEEEGLYSKLFVRDWRVAGALMEKVSVFDNPKDDGNFEVQSWHEHGKHWVMLDSSQGWYGSKEWKNDSLPRAIIEACVEALSE